MIIDFHVHLDERIDGTAGGAVQDLCRQMMKANIENVVLLHLEAQPWSAEEVASAILNQRGIHGFVNIHPEDRDSATRLRFAVHELGYKGLKLHPRLQEFSVKSEATIRLVRFAGELNVPVLIDAFPDGTHIMQGFNPVEYAELARQCPNTKIIWAHMGGHYCLDFMMLAKRLPNVWMDISYSFLYYRGSHVPSDMCYAMKSMRFERILYGSDYPDRPLKDSLDASLKILHDNNVSESEISKLTSENALSLMKFES